MAETQTYVVVAPNAVAQGGRFLAPGEQIELEPNVARSDFRGLVKDLAGVMVGGDAVPDAFAQDLARYRPHEQAEMIAARRAALEAELAALDALTPADA